MRAHFQKEKIAMSKFTLFIDASARAREGADKADKKDNAAYATSCRFCAQVCQISVFYGYSLSEPPKDQGSVVNDHYPFSEIIRAAFANAHRTECVLKREIPTHFSVYVKWYRKKETTSFEACRFRVRIEDGSTFISMRKVDGQDR